MPVIILKLMLPVIGYFVLLFVYFYISGRLKSRISKPLIYNTILMSLWLVFLAGCFICLAIFSSLNMGLLANKESWVRNSFSLNNYIIAIHCTLMLMIIYVLRTREFQRDFRFRKGTKNINGVNFQSLKNKRSFFDIFLIILMIIFSVSLIGIIIELFGLIN